VNKNSYQQFNQQGKAQVDKNVCGDPWAGRNRIFDIHAFGENPS